MNIEHQSVIHTFKDKLHLQQLTNTTMRDYKLQSMPTPDC